MPHDKQLSGNVFWDSTQGEEGHCGFYSLTPWTVGPVWGEAGENMC